MFLGFRERFILSLKVRLGTGFSHFTGISGKENLRKSLPVTTVVVREIYKK